MNIEFFGQPFTEERRLGQLFEESLPRSQKVWAITAWAQLSGLRLLETQLRRLRGSSTPSEIVLGIDGGIATAESLDLAIQLFDAVYVFHDSRSRTYHPKIYAIETRDLTIVSVGSSNLTEGGLYRNYEGNLILYLTPGNPDDERLYRQLCEYRDRLKSSEMPCVPLTAEMITRLVESGSLLCSETERQEEDRARRARGSRVAETIFGSGPDLPGAPSRSVGGERRPPGIAIRTGTGASATIGAAATPPRSPSLQWVKKLTRSDAIRKPQTSHQRNYIVLGQAGYPIDQMSWFRDVLFRDARWTSETMRTGNTKEVAEIPFEVFVDSARLGEFLIRFDHAPNRESNQKNAPTWMHWSSLLDIVRTRDLTNWFLVLERINGAFRLQLFRTDPRSNV